MLEPLDSASCCGMKSSLHRDKRKRLYALVKGTTGEALHDRRWGLRMEGWRVWRCRSFYHLLFEWRNGLCFNVSPVDGMACDFNQDSSQLILLKEHLKSAGRRRNMKLNATCLCIFTPELPVLWDRPSPVCGSQPLPCAALISVLWL